MYRNCRILPEDIVCKITQRTIRSANTCDPVLKLLNEEITSNLQKHKQNIWKGHLHAHRDHRHNTHSIEDHTWSIQLSTSNHTQLHHIQQQNNLHTQTYCELFHQTIHEHCQTHKTNRSIDRVTQNIQGYHIALITSQVQEAIKQSKNNSQGPDRLNIRHLKHIGPLGLAFLTSRF